MRRLLLFVNNTLKALRAATGVAPAPDGRSGDVFAAMEAVEKAASAWDPNTGGHEGDMTADETAATPDASIDVDAADRALDWLN